MLSEKIIPPRQLTDGMDQLGATDNAELVVEPLFLPNGRPDVQDTFTILRYGEMQENLAEGWSAIHMRVRKPTMTKTIEPRIGHRIKVLREKRGVSQEKMAAVLGLKDRQSVSAVETGGRRITASELVAAAGFLNVTMQDLANPFLLIGEKADFSWRQQDVPAADLGCFERKAGEWIGAYRALNMLSGKRLRAIRSRLGLTHTSSYEDAAKAGEDVAQELELGSIPSAHLAEAVEAKLGILVLMVDAISGVSGAACRLPEMNAILINRNETAERRNFDLAHELFHVMTWDTMAPARLDGEATGLRAKDKDRLQRIENLAQNFASGLLMPSKVLDAFGTPRGDVVSWRAAMAQELGVSGSALKWRLHNIKHPSGDFKKFELHAAARGSMDDAPPPPLFSKAFVATIADAITGGHLSARRAAGLLDITVDDLGELCDTHGVARPEEI